MNAFIKFYMIKEKMSLTPKTPIQAHLFYINLAVTK